MLTIYIYSYICLVLQYFIIILCESMYFLKTYVKNISDDDLQIYLIITL